MERFKPLFEKLTALWKKINPRFENLIEMTGKSSLLNSGKRRTAICIILAAVIVFICVFGVIGAATRGERINTKKAVGEYNSSVPDTSYLYKGATKQEVGAMIDELDTLLADAVSSADIDTFIYSDETATLLGKLLAETADKNLDDIKFKALKKDFPEAYSYIEAQQSSGKNWDDLQTIPFGIQKGDKATFISACGAIGEFLGNDMISMILKAPAVYNNALVPAIESLHTGEMPSLTGFVFKTGLSGRARVEFIIEKVLTIIEPIKEAPLGYLCGMLPDFVTNYERACDFINSRKLGLELPETDEILDSVFSLLGMTYTPFDLDYVSSLGTAEASKSGGNKGKRVEINGDRDAIFLYIADYILGHLTYENNFTAVEDIFSHKLKEIDSDSFIGKLIYGDKANKLVACLMNILAMNSVRDYSVDYEAKVKEHNSLNADLSYAFEGFMSEDKVASLIDSLDSTAIDFLGSNLDTMIYTDTVATAVAKLTAVLCGKELADIPFAALERTFPEAYAYISALKAEGKGWDDVEVIPFGITAGDKDMFIKACGAGAEHFGDVLALSIMIAPTAYEEALMPLLEALHTGPMPELKEFIGEQGLDSAKRMEIITEKVLTIIEPIKESPLTYLCRMLPELIYSYNIAADCYKNNPELAKTGLTLPPINEVLSELSSATGLILPEYDLNSIVNLSVTSVAQSGDRTGKRIEIIGDREAVFAVVATYVIDILSLGNNTEIISNLAGELLGISPGMVKTLLSAFIFAFS